MSVFIKLLIIPIIVLFVGVSVYAAAPDGTGPWADNVVSSSQGLMKNGGAVPVIRSNPLSALGVAEDNTTEGNFFSLGFGGNIILGFDNGISNGTIIVEATFPGYPGEMARIEMSEDGVNWVVAGNVTQDGEVAQPDGVVCAKFVRITDISDVSIFSDSTADGYDVDGVQAIGDSCTPTPSASPSPVPSPTSPPSNPNPTSPPSNDTSPCVSSGVTTIPSIITATRVSPTSIFISWGPDAGLNDFIVNYGFEDGNWLYNTHVSGFSTTIEALPANQPVWFQVAATDNCVTGAFGASVLVGGTSAPISLIPGFPDAGGNPLIPRLPNAGINPNGWSFLSGIQNILSAILSSIKF